VCEGAQEEHRCSTLFDALWLWQVLEAVATEAVERRGQCGALAAHGHVLRCGVWLRHTWRTAEARYVCFAPGCAGVLVGDARERDAGDGKGAAATGYHTRV
jgi:hypothetical protein